MLDEHNHTWLEVVAARDEEIRHLRQEIDRLEQALKRHAMYESELKAKLNMSRSRAEFDGVTYIEKDFRDES